VGCAPRAGSAAGALTTRFLGGTDHGRSYKTRTRFGEAKTFYKYASQFLAGDLLSISSRSELYFDEYGASQSRFDRELQAYLIDRNAGLPRDHLKSIAMLSSGKEPLIQLADLTAGVVRRAARGDAELLYAVEDKMIDVGIWPPK
jgi:hypothetical protein